METTLSITEELHKQLASKDRKIEELRKINKKNLDKAESLRRKMKRWEEERVNPSEMKKLERENTRLRAEINQIKRDRRDAKKYKKIYQIVTGEYDN